MDFDKLVSKHRPVIDRLINGSADDLPYDVFQDFYAYYLSSGQMPYGVAKARDDDPLSWVCDALMDDVSRTSLL